MKKILLTFFAAAAFAVTSFGQAPQGFKYQAVVRDASNLILTNQAVGVQLTIQQGSVGGTAVYTETFAATTNDFGLINLEIGSGTTTDDFSLIDWGNGPYFMETAIDNTGGTSYSVLGTSQLMSVPYSLYAKSAGNTPTLTSELTNDSGYITSPDDADADPSNEYNTSVVLNGTDLETTDGGGTIITDLSPLAGGGGNWTLTGTEIVNNNTGNIGMGSPTPIHFVEVGSTDTNAVMAIGHMGNFNEVYSGELIFSEDLEYSDFCGIKFQLNGSTNNLHLIGGCTTPDTIGRFNRDGQSNLQSLRVGNQVLANATSTLTVDGNIQVNGNVNITGNISKGGGTFKIDHPQDPANKYLIHSFVESPDMMNIYTGNAVTDANGYAVVELPGYFEAANKDFRYQLTVIGTLAQAIIKEKIAGNTFKIQTSEPNVEVSWSVTGVRADKFADANRIEPEMEKEHKGTYIHPELFGASPEASEQKAIEKQMLLEESMKESNNADKQ